MKPSGRKPEEPNKQITPGPGKASRAMIGGLSEREEAKMMEIKKTANLTHDELAYIKANLPCLHIEDYDTVRVDRSNKTGHITRISGEEFTKEKSDSLCGGSHLLDVMKVAYVKKTGKRLDKATRSKFSKKEMADIAKVIN